MQFDGNGTNAESKAENQWNSRGKGRRGNVTERLKRMLEASYRFQSIMLSEEFTFANDLGQFRFIRSSCFLPVDEFQIETVI